jgi:hypothetical protein
MAALSYHFGLRWEHIYDMPPYELAGYLDALAELNRPKG